MIISPNNINKFFLMKDTGSISCEVWINFYVGLLIVIRQTSFFEALIQYGRHFKLACSWFLSKWALIKSIKSPAEKLLCRLRTNMSLVTYLTLSNLTEVGWKILAIKSKK